MALTFFTHGIFRMAALQSPQAGPSVGMPFQVTSGELIHGMPWAAAFPSQNISRTVTTLYLSLRQVTNHRYSPFPYFSRLQYALLAPNSLPVRNFQ